MRCKGKVEDNDVDVKWCSLRFFVWFYGSRILASGLEQITGFMNISGLFSVLGVGMLGKWVHSACR